MRNKITNTTNKEKFDKKINSIASEIEIIEKKTEILKNKIEKLNIKKSELQKNMHYFVLENTKG